MLNYSSLSLGWHYNILTDLSQDGEAYGKILTYMPELKVTGTWLAEE
ncbi:MAG: hypothetical protein HS126_22990 [Anaerolineales bacterium]|nr:hypothetical protein [Anaerolineales bacterium]